MSEKTYLANQLALAADKSRYNEHVLSLLADKHILAYILQGVVDECKHQNRDEIVKCLVDKPEIHVTNVHPGEVPVRIQEDRNEDVVPNEGKTVYDIRFHYMVSGSNTPVKIKLLINLEAQNKFHPGYDLVTRAIYYGARMISSQRDVEFTDSNYDDIKKIYSIWICTDTPKSIQNSIAEFKIQQENLLGNFPKNHRYDILNIIFICLGDNSNPETPKYLSMLSTLLSKEIDASNKQNILEKEYHIPMTKALRKEMNDMCNLADAIEEKGIKQGIEQASYVTAKKLFKNGASYELVRNSIDELTDDELRQIYEEVQNEKN